MSLYNVTSFSGTDSDKFDAALAQIAIDAKGDINQGGTIYVPAGTYKLDRPIEINRCIILQGDGMLSTRLIFNSKSTRLGYRAGIIVRPVPAVALDSGSGKKVLKCNGLSDAQGTVIRDINLASNFQISSFVRNSYDADPRFFGSDSGIVIHSSFVTLENCAVSSFAEDGIHIDNDAAPCRVLDAISTVNHGGVYTNGTNGVGATFTIPNPRFEGQLLSVGDLVLIKDQTDKTQNGIYVMTAHYMGHTFLMRAPGLDTYERACGGLWALKGDLATTNGAWTCNNTVPSTSGPIGTAPIEYQQIPYERVACCASALWNLNYNPIAGTMDSTYYVASNTPPPATLTIDDVSLSVGDRVLVNIPDPNGHGYNGVYSVQSFKVAPYTCSLQRVTDDFVGKIVIATHGTESGNTGKVTVDNVNFRSVNYNSDSWRIVGGMSESNMRHGLYVQGGDASVGSAINLTTNDNGRWGIWEDSLEGNLYAMCHAEHNGNLQPVEAGSLPDPFDANFPYPWGNTHIPLKDGSGWSSELADLGAGAYCSARSERNGNVNLSMFLNCYVEAGQGDVCRYAGPTTVIGAVAHGTPHQYGSANSLFLIPGLLNQFSGCVSYMSALGKVMSDDVDLTYQAPFLLVSATTKDIVLTLPKLGDTGQPEQNYGLTFTIKRLDSNDGLYKVKLVGNGSQTIDGLGERDIAGMGYMTVMADPTGTTNEWYIIGQS